MDLILLTKEETKALKTWCKRANKQIVFDSTRKKEKQMMTKFKYSKLEQESVILPGKPIQCYFHWVPVRQQMNPQSNGLLWKLNT